MSATPSNPLYVCGSLTLTLAVIACGISFFGPYWLQNVTTPAPGREGIEPNLNYIYKGTPSAFTDRGLWAQCSSVCQWFWEDGYLLQMNKFSVLREYSPPGGREVGGNGGRGRSPMGEGIRDRGLPADSISEWAVDRAGAGGVAGDGGEGGQGKPRREGSASGWIPDKWSSHRWVESVDNLCSLTFFVDILCSFI